MLKKSCYPENASRFLPLVAIGLPFILLNLTTYANAVGKKKGGKAGGNFLSGKAEASFTYFLKNNPEEADQAVTATYVHPLSLNTESVSTTRKSENFSTTVRRYRKPIAG